LSNEQAPPPSSSSDFAERYKLHTVKRLPEFDTAGGFAYHMEDNDNPARALYGLVHNPKVPLRNSIYAKIHQKPITNMVTPVSRGLYNFTEDSKPVQRLVTAFDRPTGGALFDVRGTLNPRVNTAGIRAHVVLGCLKAIAALHKAGIVHRSINASRLYFRSDGSDEVVVGECYSCPPGYKNPRGCEPLEVAFADESARGESTDAADMYMLGAAIQSLYMGRQLWKDRDENALMFARVNQGSFWAMSGGQEIPGAVGALVRGLMADEISERWAVEDVLDWYEGLTKQKRTTMRSFSMNRPTSFKGTAYVDRRLLADAFARDARDASIFLRKLDFPSWVGLSMRDEVVTERMEAVLNVVPDSNYSSPSPAEDNRMVSRVCAFLHPSGSVRFKGISVQLDGVRYLIADALARDDRETLTAIIDMMDPKLMSNIAEIVGQANSGFTSQWNELKTNLEYVNSKSLGSGMERVLYELNTNLPCQSNRFERVWIGTLKQLMAALDRIAEKGGGKNIFLDRHIAAFIAARGKTFDRALNNLSAAQHEPGRFASLSAEFLAMLQRHTGIASLPHLTAKVVDTLAPAVKGLKNKKRREQVQSLLDKVKKDGDIARLTSEVNLTKIQALDQREFSQARTSLFKIERERTRLTKPVSPSDHSAQLAGYRGARLISLAVMSFVLFVNIA